ncbi:unnamed protein product [Calypogeia fissa]
MAGCDCMHPSLAGGRGQRLAGARGCEAYWPGGRGQGQFYGSALRADGKLASWLGLAWLGLAGLATGLVVVARPTHHSRAGRATPNATQRKARQRTQCKEGGNRARMEGGRDETESQPASF